MRRVAIVVAAVIVSTIVPTAPGSAARRPSCAQAKGRTLAATADVRVYRAGSPDDATIYSCWLRTARRTSLGYSLEIGETSQALDGLTIAGRYVGYRQAVSTGTDLTVEVHLTDARTGRSKRVAAEVPELDSDSVAPSGVDLVLASASGFLLWSGAQSDCYGLHVLDLTSTSTLQCGNVSELAVVGRRAYWQQDGQTRTAVVPGPAG